MKHGSLERVGSTAMATEAQSEELLLAEARIVLAIFSLVAVYVDLSKADRTIAYAIVLAYIVHSLVVLLLLRIHLQSTPPFRVMVHAVDIVWAVLLCSVTGNLSGGLLFVVFLFPLLAAAYRWGLPGPMITAGVSLLLLLTASLLGQMEHVRWFRFGLERLIMETAYLLMMAYLVGYLGEKERQLRVKSSIISHVVRKAHAETSLRVALEVVFDAILNLFEANHAALAVQHAPDEKAYLWEAQTQEGARKAAVRLSELESFQRARYFFPIPAEGWFALPAGGPRNDGQFRMMLVGVEGQRLTNLTYSFPDYFFTWHPFRSLMGVSFVLGQDAEWSYRVFVFDPREKGEAQAKLRFFQELVREVGPAVYNVYRLRYLRSRAGVIERSRIARELHDGVVQTLVGVEMKLESLDKKVLGEPAGAVEELVRIRRLLRNETLNVRELIQQIRPLGSGPRKLIEFITDTVDRFRRETGIAAQFVSAFDEVLLPPILAREVARIIQEALVNIRKHSSARNALIRFGSERGFWKLVIEDDGCGFPFSGRFSMAELEETRLGPTVLKERVRGLGGTLSIESDPSRGARLEILLPRDGYGQSS